MPNLFAKRRIVESPYAIFKDPLSQFEWRVLKTYRMPTREDPTYAIWYLATRSPHTFGSWELGDGYRKPLLDTALLVAATPEFLSCYEHRVRNQLSINGFPPRSPEAYLAATTESPV